MNTTQNRISILEAQQDERLKEEFFKQNLNLVYKVVYSSMKSIPIEEDDKISLGYYGLIKAFNTYKPDCGTVFSTYAVRCITNEILMENRKATNRHRRHALSLDAAVATDESDGELLLSNTIAEEEDEFDSFDIKLVKKAYREFVRIYSEKDIRLVKAFNMFVLEERKVTELAKELGLTQSAGSRIAQRAITALQEIAIEMEIIEQQNRYMRRPVRGTVTEAKEKENIMKRKALYVIINYPDLTSQEISKILNWPARKIGMVNMTYKKGITKLTPDDSVKEKVEEYLANKKLYS